MAKKQHRKDVVRSTPRGTYSNRVVWMSPPKKKTSPTVSRVAIGCANLDCNNRVSYRSPHHLCQRCRRESRQTHHLRMMLTAKPGSPYYEFYIRPEEEKVAEKNRQRILEAGEEFQEVAANLEKSAQASKASYIPLYN